MSYSIEQFILDSGITRAEVDEAKARMLERMHSICMGSRRRITRKHMKRRSWHSELIGMPAPPENRIVASYSTSHNHRYTAHHYETILWSAR